MKKIFQIFVIALLCSLMTSYIQAQTGIVVYSKKDTLCFNNTNLINISHDVPNKQKVTFLSKDTAFVRDVPLIDSIKFVTIPDCIVLNEDIGDWSEMRLCKNGTVVMTKMKDENTPSQLAMITQNDSLGTIFSEMQFDEAGYPLKISTNLFKITIDWLDEQTANLSVVLQDSTLISYDNIRLSDKDFAKNGARRYVPNVDEKPWTTRVGGLIEMIGGGVVTVVGGVTILGSVSTVSIPSAALGVYTVNGGLSSLGSGFVNAFTDDYVSGNGRVLGTVGSQVVTESFNHAPGLIKSVLDDMGVNYNEGFTNVYELPNNWSRAGWAGVIASALGIVVSGLQQPYTWEDLVRDIRNNVLTGKVMTVTPTTATVRGYVGSYILESPSGKFETEYGIGVYSSTNASDRQLKVESNGNGGMIEYTFSNLKPGTVYNYYTYYRDFTNGRSCVSEINSFQTPYVVPVITNFKVTNASHEPGAFTHNNQSYDYKFDVSVTVSIDAAEGIEDWGYMYQDPAGNSPAKISLKDFGHSYTDTRYAYFRNGTPPFTCTLYTYVKYEGTDEPVFGERHDYPLTSAYHSCPDSNHPHWIDLGLRSGTQWRCCNEGASTPEAYGGYYTFGQVSSAPTKEQIQELLDYCSYEWTTLNGVYGGKFTGPNGGTIFLPAAGFRSSGGFYHVGTFGYYWSSALYESTPYNAYYLDFGSWHAFWLNIGRNGGLSVRPVR